MESVWSYACRVLVPVFLDQANSGYWREYFPRARGLQLASHMKCYQSTAMPCVSVVWVITGVVIRLDEFQLT